MISQSPRPVSYLDGSDPMSRAPQEYATVRGPSAAGGAVPSYSYGTGPTFSALSQQGAPKPPAPGYTGAYPPTYLGGYTGGAQPPAAVPASAPPPAPHPAPYQDARITSAPTSAPTQSAAPAAPSAPSANAQFEAALRARFQPQGAAAAAFTPPPGTTYNPSANPFAPSATTTALGQQAATAAQQFLAQPNPYLSEAVQTTYGQMARGIDDQFAQQNQRINEEMAQRGLDASTVYGGRLQDSAAMQKTAKEQLAGQLLQGMADTYGQNRAQALGAASGLASQLYGQDAATAQLQQALRQGNYDQALTTFQANQTAQQQAAARNEQALQDYLGYGQQGFTNQLATAQFNAGQNAQIQQLLLQMLGAA